MCLAQGISFFDKVNTRKDIYTTAVEAAAAGKPVKVSLITHNLTVAGTSLIDHGQWSNPLGVPVTDSHTALTMIEDAFADFERSAPTLDGCDSSRWFYAHNLDELSDQDLAVGIDRPVARCRLEVLTLALILNGSLTAHSPDFNGKWFWQSKRFPKLVILTEWLKQTEI